MHGREEEEKEVEKVSGRIRPSSLIASSTKSEKKEEREKIGNSENEVGIVKEESVDEYLVDHGRSNLHNFKQN